MGLFVAANVLSFDILKGNLSYSELLDTIPLSDPYALLQMALAGATITSSLLIGGVIAVLFYAIIGGRAFCAWVCPVNLVTDAANGLRRKLNFDKDDRPVRISRKIRYWVMGLGLLLSFMLGYATFELISPVSIIHRGIIYGMGYGWLVAVAIFLFDLFVLKNGFCGHLCPLGGFYSLISVKSLIRIDHIRDKCTLCMLCRDVCPEPQVMPMIGKRDEMVLAGECSNCGKCIDVCADDAMMFRLRKNL